MGLLGRAARAALRSRGEFDTTRSLYRGMSGDLRGGALRAARGGTRGPGVYAFTEPEFASNWANIAAGGQGANVMRLFPRGRIGPAAEFDELVSAYRARGVSAGAANRRAIRDMQARGYTGVEDELARTVNMFDPNDTAPAHMVLSGLWR